MYHSIYIKSNLTIFKYINQQDILNALQQQQNNNDINQSPNMEQEINLPLLHKFRF